MCMTIHQVNALILSPGGYETGDFIKAGDIMTIIYLAISVMVIYRLYM